MTRIEVSIDNLKANAMKFKKNPIFVVKANAYGVGSIHVVNILRMEGYDFFAVANIFEALNLRECFKDIKILVLGSIPTNLIKIAYQNNIDVTIHSLEYFNQVKEYLRNIHIKIDTGMNRLGINSVNELKELVKLCDYHIKVKGVYTHFATADEVDNTRYLEQIKLFRSICTDIDLSTIEHVHLSNSASVLYHDDIDIETSQRIGLALYGYYPNPLLESTTNLKPVITLKSIVTQINFVRKGSYIGYGNYYQVDNDAYVATIPIGYADGLFRIPIEFYVLINNNKFRVIGKICMDQMMVLVNSNVNVNDEVIIFNEELTIDEYALNHNSISYEVLSKLSTRIPRIFK